MIKEPAKVLTIAGSDSGGAAGLQADLKTWTALGVYGMSVVTVVTAQNSRQVSGIHYMPAEFVSAQLEAVLSDYGAQAIKTGFMGQIGLITTVASGLQVYEPTHLVVDPVLVNHLGQPMFAAEVVDAYRSNLLSLAYLITPNLHEAALLSGLPVDKIRRNSGLREAVEKLHALGSPNVLITGSREDDQVVDYWSDGTRIHRLSASRIETKNLHGSGDTLSAAICAFLARGDALAEAIIKARQFTAKAILASVSWRLGKGHGPLSHLIEK
jgi:hydroxymethylpyrimidine/phosphomethylpyrimidine kinase